MGRWHDADNWYGGKIQQVVFLDADGKTFRIEEPVVDASNRFARYLGSRRILQLKLPPQFQYDKNGTAAKRLSRKFILLGRVFLVFASKDSKVFLMETNENYERVTDPRQGDDRRLSLGQFLNWHNSFSRNSKQVRD